MILEPAAVADLLMWLIFSMNARSADEGRSFLSKPGGGSRVGEKVFADGVTLRSDPFDRRNPGKPLDRGGGGRFGAGRGGDSGGLPARRTTWIEDGVVRTLRRRPLLGAEDQGRARPVLRRPDPRRLRQVARGPDRRDRARPARHPVLVHPHRQPPERHRHRADPRRRLARREGEDRPPGEQLPVQRQPGQPAQEPRGDQRRPSRPAAFPDDRPGDPGPRLPVHVEERRDLKGDRPATRQHRGALAARGPYGLGTNPSNTAFFIRRGGRSPSARTKSWNALALNRLPMTLSASVRSSRRREYP